MNIIGQRGAGGLAPENTIASLIKAIEYGVDEIEIDVRVSQDGIPVLHYKPAVTDPSGTALTIRHHRLDELRLHKPDLTTLEEAIEAVGKRRPLIIDAKPGEPADRIIAVVQQYLHKGWQPADFRFASFSQRTLLALHSAVPEIQTIVNEQWSGVRANLRAKQLNTRRITLNQHWLWSGFIRAVSRGGYQLSAYVLDDPKKAQRWQRYGLYGVVTDYPDRFRH